MSISIFKDRVTSSGRNGFFFTDVIAPSFLELMRDINLYSSYFPVEERFNLHYTLPHVDEGKRKLVYQDVIPFDIDGGVDLTKTEAYLPHVLYALKLSRNQVTIICSGNGLHFIVATTDRITDEAYFDQTRNHYEIIARKIEKGLEEANLPGKVDRNVWAKSHTLRLPNTDNVKVPETGYPNHNSITKCFIIQVADSTVEGFSIHRLLNIPLVSGEAKEQKVIVNVDSIGVQKECLFLKYCFDYQNDIREPDWYKMISIVARLENGEELCHKYSEKHQKYDYNTTLLKIEQAKYAAGPSTCQNIGKTFHGCKECPHLGKVKSPINIKGEEYIATKDHGFYHTVVTKGANDELVVKKTKPCYDDLLKYFFQKYNYKVTPNKIVFIWEKSSYWKRVDDVFIEEFAEDNFDPAPSNTMVKEFLGKIWRTRVIKNMEFFRETTLHRINLRNGVLDLSTNVPKMLPHSQEYGFTYVLDYVYDPNETCPIFDRFMRDVTCDRKELEDILLEFMAYGLANHECTIGKSLFLVGSGRNGKSKFAELISSMLNEDACSALFISDLGNDQTRALLADKLFNIAEETPKKALMDSSHFKNLVTGGKVTVKEVYKKPITIRNRCKFITLCNELPRTDDFTEGLIRRLMIIPFDAVFEGDREDVFILRKMQAEKSGILNRIIESHARFIKAHRFSTSEISVDITKEYMKDNDHVYMFFTDCFDSGIINRDESLEKLFIYGKYELYCRKQGIPKCLPMNIFFKSFHAILKKVGLNNYEVRGGQDRERAIKGIKYIGENITPEF